MSGRLTSSHWGVGVVHVENDRITAVTPHPNDPAPSRISENLAASLTGRARVREPAVRQSYLERGPTGWTGQRGAEPFVQVSWEVALGLIADELQRVRREHGSAAIYAGSYGWASAGRFHHAQSQLKRFLNAGGGFTRSEGNYSYQAALVLMPHIVGNFRTQIKETTRWRTVARHGRLVVMFGGVPLRNVQVSGGGVGRHRLRDELLRCKHNGVRFINVSPLRADAAAELEAEWLTPRPGTDTAVMMGIAHTLLTENLHDQAFLDRYTVGFERLEAYLRGDRDGVAKTAAWAARISGLPAERIERLAREMAAERTLVCTAASLQRADYGEQPLWMTLALAAMLGHVGLPGGGFGIAYGADASIGCMDRPFEWAALPQGTNPVHDFIPVAMVADMLLRPGAMYEYNGTKRRFPDIKLVWWAGGNPFHHHQDLNRLRAAFQCPQTVIVNEINWTATARHADIVLPVAAAQERTDFGAGTHDNALVPMPRAAPPPAGARIEYDIYCELERRLGLDGAYSLGRSSEEWQLAMWDEIRAHAPDLPDWHTFLAGDVIELDDPDPDGVFLSAFIARPDAYALSTPSGKLEIASSVIEGFGYDDCPGHAVWIPPRDIADASGDFPLRLISGQPETRLHSQFDNGEFSRSRKVAGREPILIHPEDAAARGIRDGVVVTVFNRRGRCLAGAVVTDAIARGVVFLWTGAWYDPDLGDEHVLDRHGNPNVLTHDDRTSRLSQGPAAQSAFVEVAPFVGTPPPVAVFEPPAFVPGKP